MKERSQLKIHSGAPSALLRCSTGPSSLHGGGARGASYPALCDRPCGKSSDPSASGPCHGSTAAPSSALSRPRHQMCPCRGFGTPGSSCTSATSDRTDICTRPGKSEWFAISFVTVSQNVAIKSDLCLFGLEEIQST